MINAKEAREKALLEKQTLIALELSLVDNAINEAISKGLQEAKVDNLSVEARDKLDELGYIHYESGYFTKIQW